MKKYWLMLVCVIVMGSTLFSACEGKRVIQEIANEDEANDMQSDIWIDWDELNEVENEVGFQLELPEVISDTYVAKGIRIINDNVMEVDYYDTKSNLHVFVRKTASDENVDPFAECNDLSIKDSFEREGGIITYHYKEDGKNGIKIVIYREGYAWAMYAPNGFWGDSNSDFIALIIS